MRVPRINATVFENWYSLNCCILRRVYFKRHKWYRLKTRRVCVLQTRSLTYARSAHQCNSLRELIFSQLLHFKEDLIPAVSLPPRMAVVSCSSDVFAQQKLAFKNWQGGQFLNLPRMGSVQECTSYTFLNWSFSSEKRASAWKRWYPVNVAMLWQSHNLQSTLYTDV